MKKFFYMSVLVLMAALTLTSCGSDDDKKDEPSMSKKVSYEATVTIAQDMLDICDVTITYKDSDAKTVTEAVTSTTWNKKVDVKKLPAVVGMMCNFKMKNGVQLTKEKYDLVASINHTVIIDGAKKGYDQPFFFTGSYGVQAEKVAEMVSKRTGKIYGYTISANGAVNETENIEF